jgi:WD40 repeat protein
MRRGQWHSVGEPLPGHESMVSTVAASEDESQIVSGSEDATIRI